MSSKGLIPSQQTRPNTFDTYYLKKGEPLVSPLEVESADGTKNLVISEDNTGVATIENIFGNIDLTPGTDDVITVNVSSASNLSKGITLIHADAPTEEATVNVASDGILELSSSAGSIICYAQGGDNTGLVVSPLDETNGVGGICLRNGILSATPTRYVMYNSSGTGGGLTAGQLDIFGYSSSGPTVIRRCLSLNPTGSTIRLGDDSIVGGAVVNVAGSLGAGRVYDTVYNTPPAPAGYLTNSGQTANKTASYQAMPTPNVFQNISGSFAFPIAKTGLYMVQMWISPGNPGSASELKINGNALSTVSGAPQLADGTYFYLQDSSVFPIVPVPQSYLSTSYQELKSSQSIGNGGNGVVKSCVVSLTVGQNINMLWESTNTGLTITDGTIAFSLIAL